MLQMFLLSSAVLSLKVIYNFSPDLHEVYLLRDRMWLLKALENTCKRECHHFRFSLGI